jgi:iron complex transport system ATP-binding protein
MKGILELRGLSVGYRARPVLNGLDLSVRAGELAVLAGPNGAGKTTLLKTAGGIIPALGGKVMLDGREIKSFSKRGRAERIGFLFQNPSPQWPFTVREILGQGLFPRRGLIGGFPEERIQRSLEDAGLPGFEERPVTELSGGEYQRVLIARAMAQGADLLLLDEPVNNLDPKYQLMIMDLLKSMTGRGIGILMSLHELALARRYADRIILLCGGKIRASGNPAEALKEEILEEVFDLPPGLAGQLFPDR